MTSPAKFRETLSLLYQRVGALQRGEKCCFGVTLTQCLTLELLHREGPRAPRDVSRELGLDTSTITRVIDVLERDGLVRRARDPHDRRRVILSLSHRGLQLAATLEASADDYCERILKRISPDRREDVLHGLRVLVDALDELPATCG